MDHFLARILRAGDVLLYRPSNLWGRLIAFKTWSDVSHVEVYVGNGKSVAARDTGVDLYDLRVSALAYILRPKVVPPLANYLAAMDWFKSVRGQRYDWFGLLVFENLRQQGSRDKMWCSNFAARFMRELLDPVEVFGEALDADKVAPSTFLSSPTLGVFWRHK